MGCEVLFYVFQNRILLTEVVGQTSTFDHIYHRSSIGDHDKNVKGVIKMFVVLYGVLSFAFQ